MRGGNPAPCVYIPHSHKLFNLCIMITLQSASGTPVKTSSNLYDEQVADIEKRLANTRYAELVKSNPYRNVVYNESPWQSFLSMLGFRTNADAYRESMKLQSLEYLNQLDQKAYNEDYESPTSEAARARQAGLNPDLTGVEGVNGASPMIDDGNPPITPESEEGLPFTIANGIMTAFSSALGMVSTFQGIRGSHLQNVRSRLENDSYLQEMAHGMLPFLIPESPEPAGMMQSFDWRAATLGVAEKYAGTRFSKGQQKKFLGFISDYLQSAKGQSEAYGEFARRAKNRQDYYEETRKDGYSEFDVDMQDYYDTIRDIANDVYKMRLQAQKSDLSARNTEAGYRDKYYDTLNPEEQASASNAEATNRKNYATTFNAEKQAEVENKGNELQEENLSMTESLRKRLKELMDKLEKKSKEDSFGGAVASCSLTTLAFLQLWLSTQGLPNISRSSSMASGSPDVPTSGPFEIIRDPKFGF